MIGKRPYTGKTRKEIRDQIFQKQIQLKKSDLPEGWSIEAADFINKYENYIYRDLGVYKESQQIDLD
jgi:hypothetical protein